MNKIFSGRIAILERVYANFRRPFYERLGSAEGIKLSLFHGNIMNNETIITSNELNNGYLKLAKNFYLFKTSNYICWQFGVTDWLEKFQPDILIMDPNPRVLSNHIVIRWMKRHNCPVIGWASGELPRMGPILLRLIRHKIAQNMFRKFDGFICYNSKAARDYMNAGLSSDCIFIAHNSTDNRETEKNLEKLGYDKGWVNTWKKSLEFDPSVPIIIFVGRLIPSKKVDNLIRACSSLIGKLQLLIVGDGPERKRLELLSAPFGNRIKFIGYQSGEPLAKCFIGSDIFVLPGLGGLALHQAMSYGKPVIVHFGDGTEDDLVQNDVNGLFFSGDVPDLQQKIDNLVSNPEKISNMGKASLSIIRTKYNMDKMLDSFVRGINEIVKKYEKNT